MTDSITAPGVTISGIDGELVLDAVTLFILLCESVHVVG